jgi:hypothetical protein
VHPRPRPLRRHGALYGRRKSLLLRVKAFSYNQMSAPVQSAAPLTPAPNVEQAVLGAGAAGLVAARELLREGHRVVVLEQSARLGGVWAYSPGNRPPQCSRLLPRLHNLIAGYFHLRAAVTGLLALALSVVLPPVRGTPVPVWPSRGVRALLRPSRPGGCARLQAPGGTPVCTCFLKNVESKDLMQPIASGAQHLGHTTQHLAC